MPTLAGHMLAQGEAIANTPPWVEGEHPLPIEPTQQIGHDQAGPSQEATTLHIDEQLNTSCRSANNQLHEGYENAHYLR